MAAPDLNIALVLRLVDRATGPARAVVGALRGMGDAARESGRANMAAAMDRQRGLAGEALAIGAMGFALTQALKPAIDFESKMAEVGKVVDFDAGDGIQTLGRDIQKLVTDGGLPMLAEGVADIVASAAQANLIDAALPDDEKRAQLIAFADAAGKMGIAFDISAEQAGKAMAVWRSSLGLTQSEALRLGDAVNHLSNNMNANAGEITNVIQRQGGVAMAAGLATEEIAALSAALLSGGTGSEIAATALKNFTGALTIGEAATDRQAQVFDKLGIDAVALAKRMQVDARGGIMSVLEALGRLEDYERGTAIRQLFGEEVLGSVTPLVNNLDLLRTAFGLVADEQQYAGAMTTEYNVIANTTGARLIVMGNRTRQLAVIFGTALLPMLNAAMAALTPLMQAVADWSAANPDAIKSVGLLAAALFGFRVAIFAVSFGLNQLRIIWAGLQLLFAVNPVVAAALAIGAAVYAIYREWDGIVGYFQAKVDAVRAAFDRGLLQGVFKAIAAFNPFGIILDGAAAFPGAVLKILGDAFGIDLYGMGVRMIESLGRGIYSVLEAMVGAVRDKLSGIVPDWMRRAWEWASGNEDAPAAEAGSPPPGRALGGAVRAGQVYRWMEEGQELFSPAVDGSVISARDVRAMRQPAAPRHVSIGDIVIHAAPGMDAQAVARAVREELLRLTRAKGGELHDGGVYA